MIERAPRVGGFVEPELLGGWRDVADEVRQLERGLRSLPDACACNHGSAHLAGACPCCRARVHTRDGGCTDCEVVLASLHDKMDALVDATLRYLPALDIIVSGRHGIEPARLSDLRWQILHIVRTFQKIATAAGEFRQGCSTSHLGVLKTLASELAAEARKVDSMLDPASARHAHTRELRNQ